MIGPVIDDEARGASGNSSPRGKRNASWHMPATLATSRTKDSMSPRTSSPTSIPRQRSPRKRYLAVLRSSARDLDHALEIANGTRYALTGGLYSRSPERIARIKREFRVGNLYINRRITGALVDRQPFGGFKLSGIGTKAGGPDYLQQFLLTRTITENTLRRGFAPQGAVDYAGGE